MDTNLIKNKIIESLDILNEAKRKYYSENFYEFNRDVLKWPDLYEPLHRPLCEFVQKWAGTKKLLLLLPRGCFKSSVVTIGYSLWKIAQDPQQRILIANATYPMAVQFLSQIKNHLTRNQEFVNIFGNMAANADSWREDRIAVVREKSYEQKEPTVWAQGMSANTTGSHFNIAILDDLVARENIGTKDQIEKTKNFYRDVLDLVDPNPNGGKQVIIIGTTWHWDDLYAWILDPKNNLLDDFEILRWPVYEGEWGTGKLLFPKRLGWKQLGELKRQQGSTHFSAQYLLDPMPEENATFKKPFKRYEETDLRGLKLNKFICVDPAISENKEADYTAMVCIGVDANNDWYILDIWREHCLPKKMIDQIFYWDDKWKPISTGIETFAFQKVLKYFLQDEMRKRNHFIPIKELGSTERSKEERIKGLQPRYESGSIFHSSMLPNLDYLEDELLRFPKGKNDDVIDALSSCLELAFPPKYVEEREGEISRSHYPA
jgi:predicted phage terminase large subunit-like protein